MSKQTHSFQAEVAQLLHLVTHSLYSNQIFLRELISNASDACDKLRFEALNDAACTAPNLEVRVPSTRAKTLTITDNGIGMSEQEAIDHLGTIAKSGTKDFMASSGRPEGRRAADRPVRRGLLLRLHRGRQDHRGIAPRRPAASEGVRWISGGTDFEVEPSPASAAPASSCTCATTPEFLNGWKLKQVIQVLRPHQPAHPDGKGRVEGRRERPARRHGQDRRVGNRQQGQRPVDPPKKDITDEQYKEFYKAISHDFEAR
jgi:molecular chaperone HtpG